ncbi:hypothetical protein [Sphingobacterium faecium]|uniref:hypothetical protein n=1 Tax=Sphingobacterium faecium TaxID=34087 RepID=UPI0032096439
MPQDFILCCLEGGMVLNPKTARTTASEAGNKYHDRLYTSVSWLCASEAAHPKCTATLAISGSVMVLWNWTCAHATLDQFKLGYS